jgi:hypothetical protein
VLVTDVQACEAQMRRIAGMNKGLAANYNAERVHNERDEHPQGRRIQINNAGMLRVAPPAVFIARSQ